MLFIYEDEDANFCINMYGLSLHFIRSRKAIYYRASYTVTLSNNNS